LGMMNIVKEKLYVTACSSLLVFLGCQSEKSSILQDGGFDGGKDGDAATGQDTGGQDDTWIKVTVRGRTH
jgi:hypothetical protein